MRLIIFSCCLLLFSCGGNESSSTLLELRDKKQVRMSLELSPSTLRMLNVQRDTAYDNMVRGIDKLSILIMNPSSFDQTAFYDANDRLMNEEGYEEYMTWEGEGYQLNILGNQEIDKMVGLTYYQSAYYILDLKGTIDLTQLPSMYESLSNQDSDKKSGLSYIFDMIKQDETDRQRQEKWQKEREKKKEARKAKKQKESADEKIEEFEEI